MEELQKHAEDENISIAQLVMANEVAVSGKSEAEIYAFIDKISTAMVNIVKSGLTRRQATLPGPIKLKTKAGDVYKRAMDDKYESQRGVGVVSAYALAGLGRERARPPRRDGADRRLRRRDAGARLRTRRRRPEAAAGQDPRRLPRRGGGRLPVQAQRDAVGRRRRLPGRDRRRVGDGRGVARAGARLSEPGRRQRARSRRCSITSA